MMFRVNARLFQNFSSEDEAERDRKISFDMGCTRAAEQL